MYLGAAAPTSSGEVYDYWNIETEMKPGGDTTTPTPSQPFVPQGPPPPETWGSMPIAQKYSGSIARIASVCKLGAQGWAPALVAFKQVPAKDRLAVANHVIQVEPRSAECVKGVLIQLKKDAAKTSRYLMYGAIGGAALLFLAVTKA